MYRPTFALDAIGRDEPAALELSMPVMAEACLFLCRVNEIYLRRFPPCGCGAPLVRGVEGNWICPRCRRRSFPPLYEAGIVYDRMIPNGPVCGDDDWADLPTVYRVRKGDCEDLACIRVAECWVRGIPGVVPYVRRDLSPTARAKHLYHIQVRWPAGLREYPSTVEVVDGMLLEDPSAVLGMNREAA